MNKKTKLSKIERYYAACARERDEFRDLNTELLAVLKLWMLVHNPTERYSTNLLARSSEIIAKAEK